MKVRISATVDEKVAEIIKKFSNNRKYRNQSHLIEEAVLRIAEEEKNEKKK